MAGRRKNAGSKAPETLKTKLRSIAPEIIDGMTLMYRDPETKPVLRQKIGEYLLDRVIGRPAQGFDESEAAAADQPLSVEERLRIIDELRRTED